MNPPTEEELDKMDLMEPGIYDFEVLKSTRKTSKSGNPMCEINVKVYGHDGSAKCFFDYLVFSPTGMCIRKIKHFCESVGWGDKYKSNNIPEEMEMLSGKLQLGIQEPKLKPEPNPNREFYSAKNIVLDYIASSLKSSSNSISDKKEEPFHDDELPF
jgi:hypothetical protein